MRILLVTSALGLAIFGLAVSRGGRTAMWRGWALGMLLIPTHLRRFLQGGFMLNAHSATFLAIMAGLAVGGGPALGPRWRWRVADALVLAMALGEMVSEWTNGKASSWTVPSILCFTLLPYLIGRWYVRDGADLTQALRPLAICLVALTACMVVEAATGKSLMATLFLKQNYHALGRLGGHRAYGNVGHPIFMGMTLLSLLPLVLTAANQAQTGLGPRWWRLLPCVLVLAVLSTVSRGPALAVLLAIGFYVAVRRPWTRLPIILIGLAAVTALAVAPESVRSALRSISGEEEIARDKVRLVVLKDREYVYTGSDHRWMLFLAYEEPLRNAGLFGYGYGELPGLIEDERLQGRFASIDNNYISWTLGRGYLGISLMIALILMPLPGLCRVARARERGHPFAALATGLIGSTVAFALAMATVAVTRDYAPYWFFMTGLAVTVSGTATPKR